MHTAEAADNLVSCIMPTYNRRAFIPHAIRYFLRQDYPARELIIIDDGTDCIRDLVPEVPGIRYYRLESKQTLGAKLNMGCEYAKGNIIANWDDDDWYADRRLSYEVSALRNTETNVCGINTLLYFDVNRKTGFKYIYPRDQRVWLLGSSLCYKKEHWQHHKFADINVGMDGLFVWATPAQQVKVLEDYSFSVHMIHNNNISPKRTDSGWWHPYPVAELISLMNEDWQVYSDEITTDIKKPAKKKHPLPVQPQAKAVRPLKNIFACLVHEKEDCIIDLVRNLHYYDPASTILLYNGGENKNLLHNTGLLKKYGAIIHPHAHPVKYGYLHDFALECMQFATDNLSFDCFTIVDSDQLLVRSNYSDYLSGFFNEKTGVGMLSNAPAKISADNRSNHVALQAFKEYELWKPLLQTFHNGEEKFVHWTFWPSTVFTAKAIKDMLLLFKENEILKNIIAQTKIWATEEVIFPTLVRLLGYEIALAPHSYDFVRFRQPLTKNDLNAAMTRQDVFWIHPVERKYENPVRGQVRERSGHYTPKQMKNATGAQPAELILNSALISRMKKINGWLSDREAELLIAAAIKACSDFPAPQHIVEIGSYHGKSTVALGNVVKSFFPKAKVFAIDPHDGLVGAADQGLQQLSPSLQAFKKNIGDEQLNDFVELIPDYSFNVNLKKPVHMLFIDGLHDYSNVARDFHHFSEWIPPSGYIAFHDYANYYPGVVAFVDELVNTGQCRRVQLADSLIIVQKTDWD
ncbi:MAG: glycosyltransferase [Chitinophagaceae bacterium]|nr:glycosyltransferase [Chitinophagaceae bacterium]MCW5926525.1 glycosyltransferase [Chitinophagaceae bacterium]